MKVSGIYIVRSGDTLSNIAKAELGSRDRVANILSVNRHIRDANRIYEGDFLFLPPTGGMGGTVQLFEATEHVTSDLKNASNHFKQMPYRHREAFQNYPTEVGLVSGVMAEIHGREAFESFLIGTESVVRVVERVNEHLHHAGENFLHNVGSLRTSYQSGTKMNNQALYREIVSFQEQADLQLTQKIGSTFRSELPANRFATKAIRSFVKGRNPLPGELTQTVKTAGRWVERMERVSTVLTAVNLGASAIDCIKDISDGADDLKKCAESLGGFVGGAVAGVVGGMLIGTLSLGGLPLIAGSIIVAGMTIVLENKGKSLTKYFYERVN